MTGTTRRDRPSLHRRHRAGRAAALASVVAAGALAVPLAGVPASGQDAPVRYRDRVFSEIEVTSDVAYTTPADAVRRLDVYEPAGDTETERPVVIWLHGAGPASDDKAHPTDVLVNTTLAQHGVVSMSINYGAGDQAPGDAAAAVDWARAHAEEYRLDVDRVVVGGTSAGAQGATRMAYGAGAGPERPVDAVMGWAGVGTLLSFEAGDPPLLLVHGTDDEVIPIELVRTTCTTANEAGVRCDLEEYPTNHGGLLAFAVEIEAVTTAWLIDVLDLEVPEPPASTTTTTTPAPTPTTTAAPAPPVRTAPRIAG